MTFSLAISMIITNDSSEKNIIHKITSTTVIVNLLKEKNFSTQIFAILHLINLQIKSALDTFELSSIKINDLKNIRKLLV